jgi:hypothetical protein
MPDSPLGSILVSDIRLERSSRKQLSRLLAPRLSKPVRALSRDPAAGIGGEDGKMIVFDHHSIGKRVAMIVTPATADRITIDEAQARRGLASDQSASPHIDSS